MMRRKVAFFSLSALALTLAGMILLMPQAATIVKSDGPPNKIFAHALDVERGDGIFEFVAET